MLANEIVADTKEIHPHLSVVGPNPTVDVLGVPFDNITLPETLDRIEQMIASGQPHYIATANVDFVVRARHDPRFRKVLLGAHLILCDGTPLIWTSRLLGKPLCERVAGSDLALPLLKLAA